MHKDIFFYVLGEMVNTIDLKSIAAKLAGSSPVVPINNNKFFLPIT